MIVSRVETRAFAHTRLADQVIANVDDQDALVTALEQIAADRPDERLVLLTNADWYVERIAAARERLEARYEIPMCTAEQFARVSDKAAFQADCVALAIPVPRTIAVSFSSGSPVPDASLDLLEYPVIGKPASSAEFYYVDYPGKLKIHDLGGRDAVDALLARLAASGFTGTYLLQEFIPGDETQMRSLTAYRDARGNVTMVVTGRVLLEEHTPGTLGVPAAILTEPYGDAMDAMSRYLDRVDYRGFANADYKRDARSGRHVFFEVNPRIGRNNWYTTASGVNPATHVMADLDGAPIMPVRGDRSVLYSVVPIPLLRRYLKERALRQTVLAAAKRGVARPLHNPEDRSARRWLTITALTWNYWRKYLQYYPRATESGH
ncbi:carboxylate--amine ligase [Demequina capsici]|uniref:Carboxylate--amine ligase n=1 Tax=Demequina capsici TaxID=3075620 RepID=A0AA96FAG7_9MICO|nr:carboxylate--amine ligase [Demequina sp. OYTSA14]WNM25720.1 carboxylate--amine ligase [Demequina sp. OYTSA14]